VHTPTGDDAARFGFVCCHSPLKPSVFLLLLVYSPPPVRRYFAAASPPRGSYLKPTEGYLIAEKKSAVRGDNSVT
jgi:hypothetical protein